jgi:prepilin-type N-terminal cleavage/methylation domain-containing protein
VKRLFFIRSPRQSAFSLIELLAVIAVIAILAALLFPALARARGRAARTACLNNVKQINLATHLYADDHNDLPPDNGIASYNTYRELINSYVNQKTSSTSHDRIFTCPRDSFYFDESTGAYSPKGHHEQAMYDYTSYSFNGLNGITNFPAARSGVVLHGIRGQRLTTVKNSSKTVLILEAAGLFPYSWHDVAAPASANPAVNDTLDMVSFVDGHVSYIKMYWNVAAVYSDGIHSLSAYYDPPEGYDYKWSGD